MEENNKNLIRVTVSKVLPEKRWKVLRMIMRLQDFPTYMPHVKTCSVLEKTFNSAITYWIVDLDGITLRWKEKSEFDFRNFTIHFKAFDGDLERLDGRWILKPHMNGTEVEIQIETAVGILGVADLVKNVIEEKVRGNFSRMLECLSNKIVSDQYTQFKKGDRSKIGGFAILGHPYNLNNLIRYLRFVKMDFVPPSYELLAKLYKMIPSFVLHSVEDFTSLAGVKSHGLIITSTFVPDMAAADPRLVFDKVVEACRVAESHHIGVAALGGFTSIVGEKYGDELHGKINIPLTTGNTFTVAMALDGVREACKLMGIEMAKATVCVVGGTGDIGSGCARILAEEAKHVIVTGRTPGNVKAIEKMLKKIKHAKITATRDNESAVKKADVVIAAASATHSILEDRMFKKGAIICDLAYPKNISHRETERSDILVFSGGLAEIPQKINLGFEIGLPSPNILYGCFSEAILLDLERRYESFSFGKGNITKERVDEIKRIAARHGFKVAPFYWGERLLTPEDIQVIRKKAGR